MSGKAMWTFFCKSEGNIRVWMKGLWIRGLTALTLHFVILLECKGTNTCVCEGIYILHIMSPPSLEQMCHRNSLCVTSPPLCPPCLQLLREGVKETRFKAPVPPKAWVSWVPWTKLTSRHLPKQLSPSGAGAELKAPGCDSVWCYSFLAPALGYEYSGLRFS